MAYASHRNEFSHCITHTPMEKEPGVFRRIVDAVVAWAEDADEREMADLIERSGGRITDNTEREMMRRRTVGNSMFH